MPISKNRLTELQAIRDDEFDTSGIPELDESFWDNAKVVMPPPKKDESLCMEIEP